MHSIIAIMLGRLEMDVDDCIETYTKLFSSIFKKVGSQFSLFTLEVKSRFDAGVLEDQIKTVIKGRKIRGSDLSEDTVLLDEEDKRCKV